MSDENQEHQPMRVDTELVRALAEMLNTNDLSEIEVEDNGRRITVKRKLATPAPVYAAPPPAPAQAAAAPAAAPAPAAVEVEVPAANNPGTVKSPMVGTVYLAGEPGAPPFIAPGKQVAAGDTLLIVEAMKVMNPITAPKAGTVRQILVQDAQPVEYDQPLVIID